MTYLRSSRALRVVSALVFVVLTGSSVIAGTCSSCSVDTQEASQPALCPMSQSSADNDSQSPMAQGGSCCCSGIATKPEVTPTNNPSSSCCSQGNSDGVETASPNILSQQIEQFLLIPESFATNSSENSTCNHFGSCQRQFQAETHTTSPPPTRSVEQERLDKISIQIDFPNAPISLERLTRRFNSADFVLSGVPPSQSGIGSLLLIC